MCHSTRNIFGGVSLSPVFSTNPSLPCPVPQSDSLRYPVGRPWSSVLCLLSVPQPHRSLYSKVDGPGHRCLTPTTRSVSRKDPLFCYSSLPKGGRSVERKVTGEGRKGRRSLRVSETLFFVPLTVRDRSSSNLVKRVGGGAGESLPRRRGPLGPLAVVSKHFYINYPKFFWSKINFTSKDRRKPFTFLVFPNRV